MSALKPTKEQEKTSKAIMDIAGRQPPSYDGQQERDAAAFLARRDVKILNRWREALDDADRELVRIWGLSKCRCRKESDVGEPLTCYHALAARGHKNADAVLSRAPAATEPCAKCQEDPELYEFRPCDHAPTPKTTEAA